MPQNPLSLLSALGDDVVPVIVMVMTWTVKATTIVTLEWMTVTTATSSIGPYRKWLPERSGLVRVRMAVRGSSHVTPAWLPPRSPHGGLGGDHLRLAYPQGG